MAGCLHIRLCSSMSHWLTEYISMPFIYYMLSSPHATQILCSITNIVDRTCMTLPEMGRKKTASKLFILSGKNPHKPTYKGIISCLTNQCSSLFFTSLSNAVS